jgi:hypothetical protein
MISTVTTSTVSLLALSTIAGSLALIAIIVLIILLVQKELASSATGSRPKTMSRLLNIGIIPLLIAFALIVVSRVMDVLK